MKYNKQQDAQRERGGKIKLIVGTNRKPVCDLF